MFVIVLLVHHVLGNQYPEDGLMSSTDLRADGQEDYLRREYGIQDPSYTNPVLRQGGPESSLRMPVGPGGMQINQQFDQYRQSPRGPPDNGPPRFDYDIVSEVAKKYKDKPYAGQENTGVNDLYDFEEKLTLTGKWDEFLDEMDRRKETGDVPKDWKKDVQYWGTWIRNAMNEKKESDQKQKEQSQRVHRPLNPDDSSPGMSPYWAPKQGPKDMVRSGAITSRPMISGQELLDKAIARVKDFAGLGGGNVIPPQLPEDGSFIGEMPQQNTPQEPENPRFNVPMPPRLTNDDSFGRGMPQVNPAATRIGPGMRRPPPNTKWPARGNLHGYRPGNIPRPDYDAYGDSNQVPGLPGPPGRDPRFGSSPQSPPSNSAWQGNPLQGNSHGYRAGNIPPPPDYDAYGDPYQVSGLPGPPDRDPRFGSNPQSPPSNSAWQGNPSQVPNIGPNMPTGAEWLKNPSRMPNLGTNDNLSQMIQKVITQQGNDPQAKPGPNYHNTIFKNSLNPPQPKGPMANWPKAIEFNIHPPSTNNSLTSNKDAAKTDNKRSKETLLIDLPLVDDFRAPIRWVKFNSLYETQDGLARVTDPKTGKNRQAIINGSIFVPVIDHSVAGPGFVITTLPPSTEAPRMPAREEAVLNTLKTNVDMKKIDERDWLAIVSALGGRYDEDYRCDGDSCQSRCYSLGCQTKCSGDTCASGCVADSCTAYCKGPGCLAMCIGKDCNARCDGQACDSRCRGEGCEAKCRSFSCHHTVNGEFRIGGGTWEQNYPQYDTKHHPGAAYDY